MLRRQKNKQMKRIIFFGLILILSSCRVGDCGCPMAKQEKGIEDLDNPIQDYPNQRVNLTEFRPRCRQKSDT